MMRALMAALLLAPLFPLTACADGTVLRGRMPSLSQGRPSVPGVGTPARFSPAPVPNADLRAPRDATDPNAVRVAPGLMRTNTGRALAGDGFAAGSAYTGDLERRNGASGLGSTVAPSLSLKVPMQVELR